MTVNPRTREQALADIDAAEVEVTRAVNRATRRVLARLRVAVRDALEPAPLVAAATAGAGAGSAADLPALGTVYGWWAEEVDAEVLASVRKAFRSGWAGASDGRISSTSLDASETFIARVRDRLVRGIDPPLPDEAFNLVRTSVAKSAAEGWSRDRLAARIAAELSWETKGAYWRSELARADAAIDAILDPLGKPGTAAREYARANDPVVKSLQAERSRQILKLDQERTYWQTRASRIARTEATAANNYGALNALQQEGAPAKKWVASFDKRTRDAHARMNDQIVPIGKPFVMDGYHLQMPGDPTAPAHLVINCRCSIVGSSLPS